MVARILLILSCIYTIALTWLSLVQLGKISLGGFNPTDKMLHAGAYLFLVLIWKLYFIFRRSSSVRYRENLMLIAVVSLTFGMVMELLQGMLTSYRDPDWWDIAANSVGVVLAVIFFLFFSERIQAFKNSYFFRK